MSGTSLGGVDHEDAFADGRVRLIEHKNARRDARAVEEIRWQTNDGLEVAGADELLADNGLDIAPEEDAMRENTSRFSCALHRADDVQKVGVITLLLGRHTPSEALKAVHGGFKAGGPGFVREGRICHDVVVGAELLAVLEFGVEQGVSGEDVGRREIMQDHVHAGETGGGHVLLLPL